MTIDHNATVDLEAAWQTLRVRWQELGTVWTDVVRERFEREHWLPLEAQTQSTGQALAEIARVIAQAHRNVK